MALELLERWSDILFASLLEEEPEPVRIDMQLALELCKSLVMLWKSIHNECTDTKGRKLRGVDLKFTSLDLRRYMVDKFGF